MKKLLLLFSILIFPGLVFATRTKMALEDFDIRDLSLIGTARVEASNFWYGYIYASNHRVYTIVVNDYIGKMAEKL